MYYIAEVRDTIRVEPKRFGENLEEVVLEICRETFEGAVSRDLGLTIVVMDILDIGPGRLVPGDGAAFYDVAFTTLNYLPENKEFVKGEVVEVTDFGVFLRLGCVDALCHVSQVSDDFYSYSSKQGALLGRESGRSITVGDKVRARIIAVTIGKSNIRVGVTMRQPGLGLEDWVEKWREKHEQPAKAKKKKKEEEEKEEKAKAKKKKKKAAPKKKEKEKVKAKKKEEEKKPKKKEEKKEIEVTYKNRTYTFDPDISLDELKSKRGIPIKVKEKVAKERGFEDYGK